MKSFSVLLTFLLVTNCSLGQLFDNDNGYRKLDAGEKGVIIPFNIKLADTSYQYDIEKVNFRFQFINAKNLKELLSLNDSTQVFFFKPWCHGTDSSLKRFKAMPSNVKKIYISESYFIYHIYQLVKDYSVTEPIYIIDTAYGFKGFHALSKIIREMVPDISKKNSWRYDYYLFNRKGELLRKEMLN